MHQLTALYEHLLADGYTRQNDRTGTGTRGVSGYQMRFPLHHGFPLATRKFVPFKLVASELLWFLKGQQDKPGAIADLHADNNHIWDEWVKADGSFGPIYGVQWRRWLNPSLYHHKEGEMTVREFEQKGHFGEACDVAAGPVDQIQVLIKQLKNTPDSRRMIVTAWQPAEIADMALPPCHVLFQVLTRPADKAHLRDAERAGRAAPKYAVDLLLYQRSCDSFLGVPFNIASYALLTHMLAHVAGPDYVPGTFVWTGGDVHLYSNHLEQAREYLRRPEHPLPSFRFADHVPRDIDAITLEHCMEALTGYQHSGKLAAEVSV